MRFALEMLVAAALLIGAPLALWLAKAVFDYFFTAQGDFWRLVAREPELALSLFSVEKGCLIDPRSRPKGYLGPFFVLGCKVYLAPEHADAIKAEVMQKLTAAAMHQRSSPRAAAPNDPDFLRSSVKFVGWTNADRPTSASALRWWAGFGWRSVALFAGACAATAFTEGTLQILSGATATGCLILLTLQCLRWNASGWARIHYRAMLIYAERARIALRRADEEGRTFDRFSVWRDLAVAISGGHARKEAVEAMVLALIAEDGRYFGSIFEEYGSRSVPNANARLQIAERVRGLVFGPQLVVCQIVQNTFGGEEAVRYILAVLKRGL